MRAIHTEKEIVRQREREREREGEIEGEREKEREREKGRTYYWGCTTKLPVYVDCYNVNFDPGVVSVNAIIKVA